jgi:MYXO-CTERM domain-containing protein
MQYSNVSKVLGASALALSLSIVPSTLPASAQNNTEQTDPNTMSAQENEADRDFDWGWLGLLGLAGLAGLVRKNEEPTRHRDPNMESRPGTRY